MLLRWRKGYDARGVEAFTAKQSYSREEALGARVAGIFRNLKMEEVYIKYCCGFEQGEANIGGSMEELYNQRRFHSSLGYLPQVEFEVLYALKVRCRLFALSEK